MSDEFVSKLLAALIMGTAMSIAAMVFYAMGAVSALQETISTGLFTAAIIGFCSGLAVTMLILLLPSSKSR